MRAVYWKEMRDNFRSWRFLILVIIVVIASGATVYFAAETVRDDVAQNPTESVFIRIFTTSGDSWPSFLWFISLFGPFLGILFGFDAVNSERTKGTLSRILSQPLFRDSVINGKFLAGLSTIAILLAAIILVVSALGLYAIGISPDGGEIARILTFYVLSVLYVGFWLGLGMLCSVLLKSTVASALVPFVIWLFFALFMWMIAGVIADVQEPIDSYSQPEEIAKHERIETNVGLISPVQLYNEASDIILDPDRRTLHGVLQTAILNKTSLPDALNPVSFRQSLTLIWPHVVVIIGLTAICFAASYIRFMREEIRST